MQKSVSIDKAFSSQNEDEKEISLTESIYS